MNTEDLIRLFSIKRISPIDGMAVTAEVWEEAHRYHRQRQQLHALFSHGPGIVAGLQVIASDPPDSAVYILPGVAVDPFGRIIILTEPTAFDLGDASGWLYLLLSYGESRPRSDASQDGEEAPLYVFAEFGIEAGPVPSAADAVELARIRRQDGRALIVDAQDGAQPGMNAIDMRFRREIGARPHNVAAVAVSYAGGDSVAQHAQGASNLARALRNSGAAGAWVDQGVPLTPDLERYTLVCLVGQKAFQFTPDEMRVLYDFVQGGGTLFIENCRRGTVSGDPPADASFADALGSWGFTLQPLASGHDLLAEPFLFAAPPPGFETQGEPAVMVGDGVIWSTFDFGCLWAGERRDGTPSREEIRSAVEWGANIVAYALARRQRAGSE